MEHVEVMRDILEKVLSGDRQALSNVFSANSCERIGRLRRVIDDQQSKLHQPDQRWQNLQNHCASIESILQDLGTYHQWNSDQQNNSTVVSTYMHSLTTS